MSKGLMVFTEGKDAVGGRVNRVTMNGDVLEVSYDYTMDNMIYSGVLRVKRAGDDVWTGEWKDRDQRQKTFAGTAELTGVKNASRALFYGAWEATEPRGSGEWTMDIEMPRGFR
jgi:hypothetical protein